MASSQVSSPFGCVLKDHNRSRNNSACCQRNLVNVVDENFHRKKTNNGFKKLNCSLHVSDVVENDKFDENCCCMSQSQRENLTCEDVDNDDDVSNLAASSLVQIWEARLRRSGSGGDGCYSRSNSGCSDNGSSLVDEDVKVEEKCDEDMSEREVKRDDSLSKKGERLDSLEIERMRVADIVKRWSSSDNENESSSPGNSPLMRFCGSCRGDQRVLAHVISSPRIRGRQAFHDLLMLLERDRHRELEALANRHVVSKFPQKGRIQSMLRLKVLQRGLAAKVQQSQSQDRTSSDNKRPSQGSHITLLRERFRTGVEQGARAHCDELNPRNSQKETNSNQFKSLSATKLNEDTRPQDNCISLKSKKEEFQTDEKQGTAGPVSEVNTQKQEEIISRTTQHKYEYTSTDRLKEERCQQDAITSEQRSTSPVHHLAQPPKDDIDKEPSSSSENTCQELCSKACHLNSLEHKDESLNAWQETSWDSGNVYPDENAPDIMYLNDWEEDEVSEEEVDDELMDTNSDWISDIARPRSYWEECRQARYLEVLSTDSSKEEIRRLLERGTVSNFLTSDLRDTIDQLMESRLQVTIPASVQDEEDSKERLEQVMRSLQREKHLVGTDKEGREGEEGEVERIEAQEQVNDIVNHQQHEISEGEEVVDLICQQGDVSSAEVSHVDEKYSHQSKGNVVNEDDEMEDVEEGAGHDYLDQYHEASDYFDQSTPLCQMPSPSQSSSWSYQVGEADDNPERAASSTSNPLRQAESYYRDTRHISCINRSSMEMELINDLREKMDSLQHEILELRRSINFCLDMQLDMQQSFKQEVHSATMEGENTLNKRRRKGRCCVCNEMQVDSLLYRCGHMCTCLKCANELQWGSGKCPICHAPIDDVVKASSCS